MKIIESAFAVVAELRRQRDSKTPAAELVSDAVVIERALAAAYARGFAEAREACEKAAVKYGNQCLDHANDMDERHSKRDRTGWRDQAIAVGDLALKLRALKPAVKP